MSGIVLVALPLVLLAGMLASSQGYYGEDEQFYSAAHVLRQKVLRIYAVVALVLGPMYAAFFLFFGAAWTALGPGVFAVTTTTSFLLVRASRYRAGAVLLSWSIWFCPEWCVVTTDQLYSPLLIWMAPSAFMAGPLLGRTAAGYAGLASVGFVAIMGFVPPDVFGINEMNDPVGRPLLFVLCGTTAIGLIAFYSWSTTGNYDDARKTLEAQNDELAKVSDALERGNREMAKILDNVEEGLVTVDAEGKIQSQGSAALEKVLGAHQVGDVIWDLVGRVDPRFAERFEFAWESLSSDWMDRELALLQLPKRFVAGEQTFAIEVEPIGEGDYLVVMSDISDQLARARAEAQQQQTMAIFRHFQRDRCGVLAFLQDTDRLVESLTAETADLVVLARQIHTVKGNSGLFGLTDVAERCHELEDGLAETGQLDATKVSELAAAWRSLRRDVCDLIGHHASKRVELDIDTVEALARQIGQGLPKKDAANLVSQLVREPVEVPLARLADQARGLASRLGKPGLVVELAPNAVRTDRRDTNDLFNALVHVVRNAVDHGIEPPEERALVGKPAEGHLRLVASREDNALVVEIRDDGRGVDWEKVRHAAKARGLPTEAHQDLVAAMFADGLSTRSSATQTSGRGVGTSAVAAQIARRGGRVDVTTEAGRGTTFRFTWPDTAPELVTA